MQEGNSVLNSEVYFFLAAHSKINTTSYCVSHVYTLAPKPLSAIRFFGPG